MQNLIRQEVSNAVVSSQNAMMSDFKTLLSSEIGKMNTQQKEIADSQIVKIESTLTEGYKFRKRGNEEQNKHNVKVLGKLKEAETELKAVRMTEGNIQTAREKIAEGISLINHRQKLVKIADSAQLGWKVVQEYEANPLADDSEDERKIVKAESRAERKFKAEKQSKQGKRTTRFHPYKDNTTDTSKTVRPGRCFNCGERGHWKRDCPEEIKSQNKISSFNYLMSDDDIDKTPSSSPNIFKPDESTVKIISPVGRLKDHIHEWRNIGASDYIIDNIDKGYKLPLKHNPENVLLTNNKTSRENVLFVSNEIEKLLKKGCISQVERKPHVVNPLTVAYSKSGKPRLVLDCRHVNPNLFQFRFKYEDSNTARKIFEKGDFVFSYDLSSAYHHLSIFADHRTYLGFQWCNKFYVFNVLPFGLSTAGFSFSKLMREIVKFWRSKGLKIIMYLDDGMGGDGNYEKAYEASLAVRADLLKFGFVIAEEKCNWLPVQNLIWLGFEWDFKEGKLRVTQTRVDKIISCIESLFKKLKDNTYRLVRVKFLASIIGQLISTQAVVNNEVRLMTRYAYECVLDWDLLFSFLCSISTNYIAVLFTIMIYLYYSQLCLYNFFW